MQLAYFYKVSRGIVWGVYSGHTLIKNFQIYVLR